MKQRKRGLRGLSMNDTELLAAALLGYEQQRVEIEGKIAGLQRQLGGRQPSAAASSDGARPAPKKRTMSAAGRKRIAAAQRKRWAARKAANWSAASVAKPSKKRTMSAAGRKRIAEATKKRWAAFRAKKSQSSQAAKTVGA